MHSAPVLIAQEDHQLHHGSIDQLFLDVILQRHARRLLSAGRLRDLGYLAAHFDCPLVAALSRERSRAARVDDFANALRRLHADFAWPYPSPSLSAAGGAGASRRRLSSTTTGATANGLMPDAANTTSKFQVLEVDVTQPLPLRSNYSNQQQQQHRIGDSGYLSNFGNFGNGMSNGVSNGNETTLHGESASASASASAFQWLPNNHHLYANGSKAVAGAAAQLPAAGGLLLQTVEAQLQPHLCKRKYDDQMIPLLVIMFYLSNYCQFICLHRISRSNHCFLKIQMCCF